MAHSLFQFNRKKHQRHMLLSTKYIGILSFYRAPACLFKQDIC